eukprot:gene23234-28220_t
MTITSTSILLEELKTDSKGLRVLLITVETRPVESNLAVAGYNSMSAVLNAAYAEHHGYHYRYIYLNQTAFIESVREKLPNEHPFFGLREGVACYNADLNHLRSSSWAKVAVLWALVNRHRHDMDYILFLDSDAAINPLRFNRSISDALDEWKSNAPNSIKRGLQNPWDASLVFLHNAPWKAEYPNAGMILARVKDAAPLLEEWWNYDIPFKNTLEYLEQDALWYMIESTQKFDGEYTFLVNDTSISLIQEFQLISEFYPLKTAWVAHCPNYLYYRTQAFRLMLRWAGISNPTLFANAARQVIAKHTHVMNAYRLGTYLADSSSLHNPILKAAIMSRKRPFCWLGRPDLRWHFRLTPNPPRLPPAEEFDGYVVKMGADDCVYLIENGTRRCFSSPERFLGMNYDFEMVVAVKDVDWYAKIPDGPVI